MRRPFTRSLVSFPLERSNDRLEESSPGPGASPCPPCSSPDSWLRSDGLLERFEDDGEEDVADRSNWSLNPPSPCPCPGDSPCPDDGDIPAR